MFGFCLYLYISPGVEPVFRGSRLRQRPASRANGSFPELQGTRKQSCIFTHGYRDQAVSCYKTKFLRSTASSRTKVPVKLYNALFPVDAIAIRNLPNPQPCTICPPPLPLRRFDSIKAVQNPIGDPGGAITAMEQSIWCCAPFYYLLKQPSACEFIRDGCAAGEQLRRCGVLNTGGVKSACGWGGALARDISWRS